jgi:hypothetical protein
VPACPGPRKALPDDDADRPAQLGRVRRTGGAGRHRRPPAGRSVPWSDAIAAIAAWPYDTILPGHGQPGGRGLFLAARAYLAAAAAPFAEASGPEGLSKRLQAAYPPYGGAAVQPVQNFFLYPTNR